MIANVTPAKIVDPQSKMSVSAQVKTRDDSNGSAAVWRHRGEYFYADSIAGWLLVPGTLDCGSSGSAPANCRSRHFLFAPVEMTGLE